MKSIIDTGYTFNAAAKQIDFSGVAGFSPRRLLAVLNLTRATIMYAPGTTGLGYTAFAAGVMTLAFDTTAYANADALSVLYDADVLKVTPPGDQDPVFDHATGVKNTTVLASVKLLDVPAGCKYLRISCESDIVVNTTLAGPAADDGKSIRVAAGPAEVIPVVPGAAVWVMSLSGVATTVRATPMKARA